MLNTCFRRVLPLSTCPILGFGLFHLSLTWTLTSHLPRDQYIFKLCYCKVKLMHMVLAISQNWLFSGLGSTCHLLDLWPGVHVTLLNMQQNGTWLLGMDEVKGEKYAIYSMPLALPWWTIIKLCTMPHHHQAIYFFLVWLLWLRLPILFWIEVVKMYNLVPDLKENAFSFSPLSRILGIGLSYIDFIMSRYPISIPTLLRVFVINGCWILPNAFFFTSIGLII